MIIIAYIADSLCLICLMYSKVLLHWHVCNPMLLLGNDSSFNQLFSYLCGVCHWMIDKVFWIMNTLDKYARDFERQCSIAWSVNDLFKLNNRPKNARSCKDYLIPFRSTQSIWNPTLTLHRAGVRGQSEGTQGQIILDKCRLYVHIKISLLFNWEKLVVGPSSVYSFLCITSLLFCSRNYFFSCISGLKDVQFSE